MLQLGASLHVQLPTSPNQKQQLLLRKLTTLKNKKFDKEWTDIQVEAHKLAIADTEKEIAKGKNKKVVREAKYELPRLKSHLTTAEKIHDSLMKQPKKDNENKDDSSYKNVKRDASHMNVEDSE